MKRGKASDASVEQINNAMRTLNKLASETMMEVGVHACTDVTGFGLLGHLVEMCDASDVSAVVQFDKVPFIDKAILDDYLDKGCIPGGTKRNWASYGHKIGSLMERQKNLLCDPQTSGGLMVAVIKEHEQEFVELMNSKGFDLKPFGEIILRKENLVEVV